MATSYNHGAPRAQTYPQPAPQLPQAQFGAYNPGPVPSYGGQSNPRFNPNPTFSFGMPQQAMHHVANLYNHVPQQQQQQQQPQQQSGVSGLAKYNGLFSLLGGALKLAGTVLGPTLRNDWDNYTGN